MKILTFLLEITIVLVIILCLYYAYLGMMESSITNNNEELITEKAKNILNNVSDKTSLDNSKKTEEDINKLMKKYNIN